MARLILPDQNKTLSEFSEIKQYLNDRGVLIAQWQTDVVFSDDVTQEQILDAYSHELKPYMEANGYGTADVINVNATTPNLQALRDKFLAEHTHSEDEIRFFVDGQGYFWFHLDTTDTHTRIEKEEVFCVHCQSGDLLSVPMGVKHWFDMGDPAFVKVIRIFTDMSGWTPHYTASGIDQKYHLQVAY